MANDNNENKKDRKNMKKKRKPEEDNNGNASEADKIEDKEDIDDKENEDNKNEKTDNIEDKEDKVGNIDDKENEETKNDEDGIKNNEDNLKDEDVNNEENLKDKKSKKNNTDDVKDEDNKNHDEDNLRAEENEKISKNNKSNEKISNHNKSNENSKNNDKKSNKNINSNVLNKKSNLNSNRKESVEDFNIKSDNAEIANNLNNEMENQRDLISDRDKELLSDNDDNLFNDKKDHLSEILNDEQKIEEKNIEMAKKEADVKEGDVIEITYSEEHKEDQNKKETNEIIKNIMEDENKNRDELEHEKHDKKYMKRTLIKKIPFSVGNLDVYMHVKYSHVNVFVRCLIECIVIGIIFLIWPFLLILIIPEMEGYNLWTHLTKIQKTNPVSEFLRQNVFITLTYFIFIGFSLVFDNILYITAFVLTIFDISVKGRIGEILQVISSSRKHLRNTIVSLLVFIIATRLLSAYVFFSDKKDLTYVFLTSIFWYSCISAILFIKTFLMNFLTSELRRKSFRGRIWDTNYKTFVFKKLAAIAEATPQGSQRQKEVIYNLINDYDTGFFLRHNDLNLKSKEQAKEISEGIFAFLEIQEIEFEMIEKFFPENSVEVYAYLSGISQDESEEERNPISFETISTRCTELYQERMDIARSLYDRDNILRKLDFILTAIVSFFSLIIFLLLLNVDYKVYVASVGPFLFGFGWIFQDSIKELYRCFIFHLVNHPFDCGDRVCVDKEELVVLRIDLLYTTYVTVNGKIKYIPNASMFLKNVENIRRSDIQAEDVGINIKNKTTFVQMLSVRDKLSEAVKRMHKEFTGNVYIKNYEAVPDGIKIIITIEHTSNFQEVKPKLLRRDIFIKLLEETLNESGIEYDHCYVITD